MMQIREERSGDVVAIERLTIAAFRDAPHTDHTEQFIVRELRRSCALAISLVAESEGEVIGHVALSPVSIADGAKDWYGLGPISVLPSRQRTGVGSQLMQHALAQLEHLGAAGCVVLGDPGFHGRFGFIAQPSLVLPGVPVEYFQAVRFRHPLPSGVVTYHPAFGSKA